MYKKFDISDISLVAKEILNSVNSKIILFYGEMGIGKTTLISAIVKELGYKYDVSSPTFSIVNEYEVNDGLVYHFDFFRLNDESEAYDIGFEDYLYSGNWCFIEWPDKVVNLLPQNVNEIYLEKNQDLKRNIKLKKLNKNIK